jgi:hypothetical protein
VTVPRQSATFRPSSKHLFDISHALLTLHINSKTILMPCSVDRLLSIRALSAINRVFIPYFQLVLFTEPPPNLEHPNKIQAINLLKIHPQSLDCRLEPLEIVSAVVGVIAVIVTIIFGVHQWRARDSGQKAIRDFGSWFCGCGRRNHYESYPRP